MSKSLPYAVAVLTMLFAVSRDAGAQTPWPQQQPAPTMDLAGPRVGMTVLDDGARQIARNRLGKELGPVISQFGWQKERQFMTSPTGFTGVTEFVGLIGGVDQGLLLPSFSWLVGVRTINGVEFAMGPNIAAGGVGLAGAAGVTFRAGALNIPINFAAVRSDSGVRVSILAGFNSRRR